MENYQIIKPNRLVTNSNIGLIAPAGKINIEKFDNVLKNLEEMQLTPVFTNRIFEKDGYLAGNDRNRLDDLHEMFDNKNISSIICIRGGYGVTRLLPFIDYDLIKANPKVFIGYSDITALQYAFYKKSGLISFHGIVGASSFSEYTKLNFQNIFYNNISKLYLNDKNFERNKTNSEFDYVVINKGVAEGEIIGGNLSLMVSLIGTEYDIDYTGKIVMIEEIDEYPYKIDRMLTHLLQATNIIKASSVIFGIFKDCSHQSKNIDPENTLFLNRILKEKFNNINIPIIYGFPFGHIANQSIFPIGIKAEINTFNNTLSFKENIFAD
jgi:muramoyltetrapeptide carboxypeptidase